jgi:PEP-CTERM motif-containing protein
MKNLYRAALLVVMGLASLGTAQAAVYTGDLIVGFTTQSGNDAIYDLGTKSSLFDGETWNLSSLLTGYNLNNVNWGVIGDATVSGVNTAWTTVDGGTPSRIPNTATWGTLNTATKSIYSNFSAAGAGQSMSIVNTDDNSWNKQTISGTLTTQYVNAYENPNLLGLVSDSFYGVIANNSAPALLGHFTLDGTSTLTFNAVPEPATDVLAGTGLLILIVSFRNKFRRKQV